MTLGEIGVIVTMCGLLVAAFWAVMTLGLRQFEKRLDERFAAQEATRVQAKKDWDKRFEEYSREQRGLERAFADFRAELPKDYWRREDAIRNDTVTDAKLDAISARLERVLDRQNNCPLTGHTQKACALVGAKEAVSG